MKNTVLTLHEIKRWLKIDDDNSENDNFLSSLAAGLGVYLERYLGKPMISRQFVEYYNGRGTRSIMLRQRPVYSIASVYDDLDRDFSSSTLIAATEYDFDGDIGKLYLDGDDVTIFSDGHQNVKVTYTAGLSRFRVQDEENNYLDVTDSGGTVALEITGGEYTAEALATAIQTALNADGTLAGTFTVTYRHGSNKFVVASDANFQLLWSSGSNAYKSMRKLLGYEKVDTVSATSAAANYEVTGIPDDLIMAAGMIANKIWDESRYARGSQQVSREILPAGGGTVEFMKTMPIEAKAILDSYRGLVI